MQKTVHSILVFLMIGNLQARAESAPSKSRMEELFIWKVSDELKLSTPEEKKFTELFRDLNLKKSHLGKEQDEILNELGGGREVKAKWLGAFRKNMEENNKIQLREFDELKKILGTDRLAKYLLIKRDFTNKVKNLLAEKSEKKERELPPPKVIVE